MKKVHFGIDIHASREKVWKTLWGKGSYEAWTAGFAEGSTAITDWKEGSKVLFLAGNGEGMVSVIEKKIPGEFMLFRHLGNVKKGVEDVSSESVKEWAGAQESYTLRNSGDHTRLDIEMDVVESHLDFFSQTWPGALQRVKELSETN